MSEQAFSLTKQDNGIALVAIDVPNESMNVLKDTFVPEIEALLDAIEQDSEIQGVVIYSAKDNSFVAGADVSMLEACTSAEQGSAIGRAINKIRD